MRNLVGGTAQIQQAKLKGKEQAAGKVPAVKSSETLGKGDVSPGSA